MPYVYRKPQNGMWWGSQNCVHIQEHVMFSKLQERTQSQRCEFQNKVINEFNCGIYRFVTTLYLQQLILKFVYFRSCLW